LRGLPLFYGNFAFKEFFYRGGGIIAPFSGISFQSVQAPAGDRGHLRALKEEKTITYISLKCSKLNL
jgi:hypothetical protein